MQALPLYLCSWLLTQAPTFPDLSFRASTLARWEGQGFAFSQSETAGRPESCVSSQDASGKGHKAMLHQAFVVPPGAGILRCRAYAARGRASKSDDRLDIVLMAAGKRIVPKQVASLNGWQPVAHLLPAQEGQPQEYVWRIGDHVGEHLRIVLVDEDDRPGYHVRCSGFEILAGEDFEVQDFTHFMARLVEKHHLAPVMRYSSPHFLALSNADENFTETHLGQCELLYGLFWNHFRRKGFTLRPPPSKLMVAMFDSQIGFNAYLGRNESPVIIGMYHPLTNRLVVYDYGQNEIHRFQKNQAEQQAKQISSYLERQRSLETVQRRANDFRAVANLSTIMHEVAHQLSFNCGLLSREGDVPFWLAEGLACYCEATENGSWQGLGELNPQRLGPLAAVLANRGTLIRLTDLLTRDDWMPSRRDSQTTLLAYAQSWALFHMLMEEQPQNLKAYLKRLASRQIRDRRLADFQQAFGQDLAGLERHYGEYVQALVQRRASPSR